MQPCFFNVAPPDFNHSGRRTGYSYSCPDSYFLVGSIAAVAVVVVFLGFFACYLNFPFEFLGADVTRTLSTLSKSDNRAATLYGNVEEKDELEIQMTSFVPPSNSPALRAKPASFELSSPSWSAVVYSDHSICSDIGRSILLRGGNAVDASIAVFFCLSAALPHRGGPGGGLMATIYSGSKCATLNAREFCPTDATEAYFTNRRDETAVAAGVPVFLNGLYRTFEKYSSKRLTWHQLVSPTVDLCVRGIPVTKELSRSLMEAHSLVTNSPRMRSHFVNETTGEVFSEKEKMFCPLLGNFLREVAEAKDPVDFFYRGEGSRKFLRSSVGRDGFITAQDLEDCESEFQAGVQMFLGGQSVCGPPPPSIYSIIQLAVAAMYEANSTSVRIPLTAWDKSKLIGDAVFDEAVLKDSLGLTGKDSVQEVLRRFRNRHNPEIQYDLTEKGSFSVLIVDEKGDAVSMTSSLGDKFGNREFTEFGFFMNNAMSSFTYDTNVGSVSSRNSPQSAKCPLTQMSPLVGTKDGKVSFLSGGTNYLGICASVLRALTSLEGIPKAGAPLVYRNMKGLHSWSNDESLLTGY
ncbi:hypothetical protein RB195_015596 [Necator americanus]